MSAFAVATIVPSTRFSTRDRILAAAEELFARRGFESASLRRLTADAGVNLAAVNYHFGSKDHLVEEVFRRRLDTLNGRRLAALDRLDTHASLEDVLEAFIRPPLELSRDSRGGRAFVRIMARAYVEHDEQLRTFLSTHYGDALTRFADALAARLPALDREELYWRLDIVTGALTYAMGNFGIIRRKTGTRESEHLRQVLSHLVHFAAAGLRSA